jgi:predicted RNase H-like HicB family nuclease
MKLGETFAMEIQANIHLEDGSYWADVPSLPGCFAAGTTLDELFDSLREGVELYLADDEQGAGGISSAHFSGPQRRRFCLIPGLFSEAKSPPAANCRHNFCACAVGLVF